MVRKLIAKLFSILFMLLVLGAGYWGYHYLTDNSEPSYAMDNIPPYSGSASVIINNDKPVKDIPKRDEGLYYGDLDALGRTGAAEATLSPNTLAEGERGDISHIKPAGWHTVKYPEQIEDRFLWNRCHCLGWVFSFGDRSNVPELLFTGTRYLNVEGMLPIEKEILYYIKKSGGKIYYRVTPMYTGDNLIADGVLMEAVSEDGKFSRCRYCFNVQPKIGIDYKTGESWIEETK